MAIRRIMKHLDKAFVQEEENLPKFVDGILGNIESWLKSETVEAERMESKPSNDLIRFRKTSLLLAGLSKKCDYVGLIKIDEVCGSYLLKEYQEGKAKSPKQALPGMPPVQFSKWYKLPVTQSSKLLPQLAVYELPQLCLQYIDEQHAIAVHSSLPAHQKSALLSEITQKIEKIR